MVNSTGCKLEFLKKGGAHMHSSKIERVRTCFVWVRLPIIL
jgi:hypothetical protein